jgi:hypothetical protein
MELGLRAEISFSCSYLIFDMIPVSLEDLPKDKLNEFMYS